MEISLPVFHIQQKFMSVDLHHQLTSFTTGITTRKQVLIQYGYNEYIFISFLEITEMNKLLTCDMCPWKQGFIGKETVFNDFQGPNNLIYAVMQFQINAAQRPNNRPFRNEMNKWNI